VLRPTFEGRAVCRIILNLSSEARHASETASTLRFGECLSVVKRRAKSASGSAARSAAADEDDAPDPSPSLEDTIKAVQARLAELDLQVQQLADSGQDGRAADASGFSQAALVQFDGYKAELARVRAAALTIKQQISEARSQIGASGLVSPAARVPGPAPVTETSIAAVPTGATCSAGTVNDVNAAPVSAAAASRLDAAVHVIVSNGSAAPCTAMDIATLQSQLGQLRSREAVLVGMVVRQASMGMATTPSQAWVSKQAEADAFRAKLDRLRQLLPP
jgi:hypothetical protein